MSWKDVLKSKGKTDAEIAEIEKAVGASGAIFDEVISGADQASRDAQTRLAEAAEKERKINEFWDKQATPQINEAFSRVTRAEAEAAFYRTQAEEAKKLGFIPGTAPGFDPAKVANPNPANPNPTFNPNANPVPGSPGAPQYMTQEQAVAALSGAAFLMTEHQRLFNEPLPNLGELMQEAGRTGKKATDVWMSKYNVEAKRKELADAAQKAHDDAIRTEAYKKAQQDLADKYGNENSRPQRISARPEYIPKDAAGKPDTLAWTKDDKRTSLRQRIHEQVAKEGTQRVN